MHATYSPEDDKIRLYFDGVRIPRDEWDRLKAAGFSWTMKQASDMVAHWSPNREDLALEYAGVIEDEDQPQAERSLERAERFTGYLEKREGEATALADEHTGGPAIHAHQSERRAEIEARKHDRKASAAVDQWSKAEYWQRRTAGVIAHAKFKERADVRHRRIKGLESELRIAEADITPRKVIEGVEHVERYCGAEYVSKGHDCVGIFGLGRAAHSRSFCKATGVVPSERHTRIVNHLRLRIAYEKQMLEAQGGTMADVVEMEPGGFYGNMQIQKVTKDRAGLVSKVYFIGPHPYKEGVQSLHAISAERMKPGSYRAPTDAERAAFVAAQKAAKASKPKAPPLLNPTMADALKLQTAWNAARVEQRKASHLRQGYGATSQACMDELAKVGAVQPVEMTQEQYTARSSGYGPCNTLDMAADWADCRRGHLRVEPCRFRVRVMSCQSDGFYAAPHVVVITDKPQTTLPAMEVAHAVATV